MTFTSQKTPRLDLVSALKGIALLADDVDGTAHVVGYFEPDPRGISPFVCVDSAGALYSPPDDGGLQTPMRFVVGVWVRRDIDPATAEDQLNDLALEIANVLRDDFNARFTDFPTSDFEMIEGVPYKFELHFVELDS
jgi:hypothetical protein